MFVVHVPSSSDGDLDRDNIARNKDLGAGTGDGSHPPGGIFGTKVDRKIMLLRAAKHIPDDFL